jgi:pimeloyl-ACP methyl ester carboxylesterase
MSNPMLALLARPFMQRRQAKRLVIDRPEGIREEGFIPIGGISQWVTIRGQDRSNPIVLVLHGGPGAPYVPFNAWIRGWEKHFTIVQWDQRGGGFTFKRNGADGCGPLALQRLASDGLELADMIFRRFGRKPILIGSSIGSIVGVMMIRERPGLFCAYVGTEQNSPDSNPVIYQLVEKAAVEAGNYKGQRLLAAMGADPARWTREEVDTMNRLAIRLTTGVPNMIYDLMLPALMYCPDYSLRDINIIRLGMEFSARELFAELKSFDIRRLGYRFELPFFIFQGEADILTPVVTAEAYFQLIEAPHKGFVLIRNAGHLAAFANPDHFLQELRQRVRPFAI